MYHWGELVIHHKVHSRKVYDFAHRHLPEELLAASEPNETENGYHDWYTWRRLGGVGLLWGRSGDAWLSMPGIKSRERQAALTRLVQKGSALQVQVQGMAAPFYMRVQDRAVFDEIPQSGDRQPQAAIVAPLDNLLWDRRLVEDLFDFQYRWEVYKPVSERQYGYYVLPILYGDRFVARFEPGRDKENGALLIKRWWWEPGITPTQEMRSALRRCFQRFLSYLGTGELRTAAQAAAEASLGWLDSAL
jgi:uncharacterized protein YcaQ